MKNEKRVGVEFSPEQILKFVENLVGFGLISDEEGQKIRQNHGLEVEKPVANAVLDKFKAQKADFFGTEAGKALEQYLLACGAEFDQAELEKIAEIVDKINENAVAKHMKGIEMEQKLNSANESSIEKLNTVSNSGSGAGEVPKKAYSIEEIGKMSPAEFMKIEKQVMDDFVKGLLK